MLLPDVAKQVGLTQLLKKMPAQAGQDFQLFDARHQTHFEERATMLACGLEVKPQQLRGLANNCLAYKDCQGAWRGEGRSEVHIAYCEQLKSQDLAKASGLFSPLPALLCPHETLPLQSNRVCQHCLQELAFKGFDMHRPRHRSYSERVLREFDLFAFFADVNFYPV